MGVTTLVRQRMPTDCGVCCLAMLTGRSYEHVLAAIADAFEFESGLRRSQVALERLGFAADDFVCRHRIILAPEFFREFAWGRRALLTVPSRNRPGQWHMVYCEGATIFDPSPHLTYERWSDLRQEEIVLFREH